MGEKEKASNDQAASQGVEKSVQWEPHRAPTLGAPEEEAGTLKTRHDSAQAAIQNTR